MARRIRRAAVLGSGVMGSGIAAHLAGAGVEVLLLDITPTEEGAAAGHGARSRIAQQNLGRAVKARPAVFHDPVDVELISVGNFDDDLARVADCDWIVEAVTEDLSIKRDLFARVEAHRRAGSLVTSNTSGLSIAAMTEGRSDNFRKHFFVTHFFNPVRYMRLLELVPGDHTDFDALAFMARFGADELGKGIVFGKDTPNFVANRIGTFAMLYLLHKAASDGYSVEEIDTLFGVPMGRPKSAVFRTADLVGLDTLVHVADNCYATLGDDEARDTFQPPQVLTELVQRGWLGQKSGQGFYRKQGGEILALDLSSLEYRPKEKVRVASIGAVRKIEDVQLRVRKLLQHDDRLAKLAWDVTASTLIYSAHRIGEIADDVVNIDKALRWGFNWELGPFELWDAIGLEASAERMRSDGRTLPERVERMLSAGMGSFYGGSTSQPTYYEFGASAYRPQPLDPRHAVVRSLKQGDNQIKRNSGASIHDIGDGVLCVVFHTKMNTIDADVLSMLHRAIDIAEADGYAGIVIGNNHPQAFCAGADLFAILVAAGQGHWDVIEQMVRDLQGAALRMGSCPVPVVAAVAGLALGGGTEIALGGDAVRAHAETYMGLVEVGVGLIPAGGGCWGMLERFCGSIPDDPAIDRMPFIRQAFTNIAMAKVSTGAQNARRLGYLRAHDGVSLNRDLLLHDAKQTVLGLQRAGYRPPRPTTLRLPGATGEATIGWFVEDLRRGDHISDHDQLIAKKLAHVLCGGDTSTRVKIGAQRIIELEREAFMSLLGEPKTQERMQHMLQRGKPLRN